MDADNATPVVGNRGRGAENVVGEAGGSDPACEEGHDVRACWDVQDKVAGEAGSPDRPRR